MRRISVIAVIFMFLGICNMGYAQTPVEIHTGGNGAVSNTNPLPITGEFTITGGALETTQLLIQGILQGLSDKTVTTTQAAQMLTQLLKLKFTGEDLKTVFSNTSIGVTATDLDMRDLSQATDTIQVFQPDPSQAKFLMYGNTAKDGTGIFYVPKLDTDGHLQIDVLTLPAITGAVTSNSGTGWADSGIAKETGGNLEDTKTAVEAIETRLDDMTYPDTGFTERFTVNGYSETTKSYEKISHVEVYVQTADKVVRMGLFGNDTTTNYVDIDKTETPGWVRSNVRFPTFDMAFKGNTETDTAIVVVQGWKYTE